MYGVFRIVGGCLAGHIPWYVFFWLEERAKCGGVLINKFCEKFPCSRVKDGNIEQYCIVLKYGIQGCPYPEEFRHKMFSKEYIAV